MSDADEITALAVYGSLMPGGADHWVVSRIAGEWVEGTLPGYTFEITWGPAEGYEGFIGDRDGPQVPVAVLVSEQLERKWREIDDFEGQGYERRILPVRLSDGRTVGANVYVALTEV